MVNFSVSLGGSDEKVTWLVLILCLVLTGCKINQNELRDAEKVCSDHEGIYELWADGSGIDVVCKDGKHFNDVGLNKGY